VKSPFGERNPVYSPDGRWIAYMSDESGRWEIYVISVTGPAGKWQVSTRGGRDPAWSPDGRELYYLTEDSRMMSVPITGGPQFSPGTPRVLFNVRYEVSTRRNVFCVAPDNQRFLFLVPNSEISTPMTAVINWRAGLGRH
jgi:dipeptidyl aminopeptidase/acylaminoacyl peptidase